MKSVFFSTKSRESKLAPQNRKNWDDLDEKKIGEGFLACRENLEGIGRKVLFEDRFPLI
jgi:hypothetical protein